MKSKEFYLKQLKYYKGEEKSPYKDHDRSLLWFYESAWFFDSIRGNNSMLEEYISYYLYAGLSDLPGDVPIGYKALLFNAYRKGSMSSVDEDARCFREFFAKYY